MAASIFQPHLLAGQNAFITGGGTGINHGIARRFVEHGANVVIVGRRREVLDQACARLNAIGGGRAVGHSADVRQYEALKAAADAGRAEFGPYDVVVAGAAGNFPAPAVAISSNGFSAVVDIDLKGTFHAFKACFEHLRTPGARLMAISATQAFIPTPFQAHVCAAKAGVDILLKTLAMEWGPAGIRVNGIAPGPVDGTEGMDRLTPGALKQQFERVLPLQRYATIDEMADMALFLASPAAAYMTGHVVVIDGGQSLMGAGSFGQAMGG